MNEDNNIKTKSLIYFYKRELKKNKYYCVINTMLRNQDLLIGPKMNKVMTFDEENYGWGIDYNKYLNLCNDKIRIESECMSKAKKKYNKYIKKIAIEQV